MMPPRDKVNFAGILIFVFSLIGAGFALYVAFLSSTVV